MLGQAGARDFGSLGQGAVPQHAPVGWLRARFPSVFSSRTAFAVARPPWTYYVSLYLHLEQAASRRLSREAFKAWLYRVTHAAAHDPKVLDSAVPEAAIGVHWTSRGEGHQGLCTAIYRKVAGFDQPGVEVDAYVALDRLREGFQILLGEPLQVQYAEPRNAAASRSPPRPEAFTSYPELYDAEMVEWVARADAGLIGRFGWEPFRPSPAAFYYS